MKKNLKQNAPTDSEIKSGAGGGLEKTAGKTALSVSLFRVQKLGGGDVALAGMTNSERKASRPKGSVLLPHTSPNARTPTHSLDMPFLPPPPPPPLFFFPFTSSKSPAYDLLLNR